MNKIERKGRVLEDEIRVKATPQQAWEAWARPERVADWFVDEAKGGEPVAGAEMTWVWKNYGMSCPLKVLESIPGERVVLEWPMPQGGALIWEIDVRREGGETVVKVVSSGFGEGAAWDEQYEGQKHGWAICLAVYKAYLEAHFGKRRRDVVVMRPLDKPVDLYPAMSDKAFQARCLGAAPGAAVVDSGREICVPVDAIGGLVTFKAVGGCGSAAKMLVIHASGWRLSEPDAKALEKRFSDAVDELLKTALQAA